MPVNPSTWGQRQEDWKFQDNLGYMVNVRPKWTAQGDSASEDKHNKLPGRKGPQVKTGPLRRPALPFFSFPVRGTVTASTAGPLFSCSLSQEGQPWNQFRLTGLQLHGTSSSFVLSYFEFSTKRILHSMWSRPHSTHHTVLSPKGYSSLAMACRLREGRDHSVSYLTF